MRIAHYSIGLPPFRSGGLVQYCLDLMRLQSKSNEVIFIYPGNYSIRKKSRVVYKSNMESIKIFEIKNPKPISLVNGIKDFEEYKKEYQRNMFNDFFKKQKVDIVHIHTLMGLDNSFFDACKENNIKVVFTTHDYFGLCPINFFFDGEKICESNYERCYFCNQNAYSIKQIKLMQSRTYEKFKHSKLIKFLRNKIRKKGLVKKEIINGKDYASDYKDLQSYYINLFSKVDLIHCNSSVTKYVYDKYLPNIPKVIKRISHSKMSQFTKIKKTVNPNQLRFLFLGPEAKLKGFDMLIRVLSSIYEERQDFKLLVYSRDDYGFNQPFIEKYGAYRLDDLPSILKESDILLFPSICRETFGFTVMEAYANGTPSVVSGYAGARDMIEDKKTGIVFDGTEEGLKEALLFILNNPRVIEELNQNIIDNKDSLLLDNLIDLYKEVT